MPSALQQCLTHLDGRWSRDRGEHWAGGAGVCQATQVSLLDIIGWVSHGGMISDGRDLFVCLWLSMDLVIE